MYIACIDTGTTNTRVCIRDDKKVFVTVKKDVGVRITSIDGSNQKLLSAIHEAYQEALADVGIPEAEISIILASGMISSNLGAAEIPHLIAPVSMADLAAGIVPKIIPEISNLHPIHFIPGVKNAANGVSPFQLDNLPFIDMMRGEEVEAFGVLDLENIKKPAILILTGSHTKFVYIDENGTIQGCLTTMAGETLMQYTSSTIISKALNYDYARNVDTEYLLSGADTCAKMGLTRASFCVRTLEQFSTCTVEQRECYILGAVLEDDFKCVENNSSFLDIDTCNLVVCGSGGLGDGLYALLKNKENFANRTYKANTETMKNLSSYGCYLVAKKAGLI